MSIRSSRELENTRWKLLLLEDRLVELNTEPARRISRRGN